MNQSVNYLSNLHTFARTSLYEYVTVEFFEKSLSIDHLSNKKYMKSLNKSDPVGLTSPMSMSLDELKQKYLNNKSTSTST